jgi:hypothetical protein
MTSPRRAGLAAALVLMLTAAAPVPAPRVVLAGRPLIPSDVTLVGGVAYVALRPIAAAYGAAVSLPHGTRTVVLTTLLRQVVLTVGQPQAVVNGQPVTMPAPPLIVAGRVVLAIRALPALFGARVSYDAPRHTVIIAPGRVPRPMPPAAKGPAIRTITGTVTRIAREGSRVELTVAGSQGTYAAGMPATQSVAFRDVRGAFTGYGDVSSVHAGDRVVLALDATDHVLSFVDLFASVNGTVGGVADRSLVLTSGRVIAAGPDTTVTLDGQPVAFGALRAGDILSARADPVSGAVHEIVALTPGGRPVNQAAGGPAINRVTVALPGRALRAGDLLEVTVSGTPGCQAQAEISDVLRFGLSETRPGEYSGRWPVTVGTNLTGAPLIVRLSRGGTSAIAEAANPISIITTPPAVGSVQPVPGATINLARPNIVVTFATVAQTGMVPDSLRLTVNGRDVTPQTTRTPAFLSYYPSSDLPLGPVRVRVQGTDIAGNSLSYEWGFTVTR